MQSAKVTVALTATQLDDPNAAGGEVVTIANASGDIWLGGSGVTDSTGLLYSATDGPLTIEVDSGGLYAIAITGSKTVDVLRKVG